MADISKRRIVALQIPPSRYRAPDERGCRTSRRRGRAIRRLIAAAVVPVCISPLPATVFLGRETNLIERTRLMNQPFQPRSIAGLLKNVAIAAAVIAVVGAADANAQKTEFINQLIGNDVDEVGPKYNGINDAMSRFLNRDFPGSLQLLKEVTAQNPELPPAGVLLGKMFAAAKNTAAARNAIENAVTDSPNDPEAFVIFADTAVQQRRWTDAELNYRRAYALVEQYSANPKRKKNLTISALNGLAAVSEFRKDWKGAEGYLTKLKELAPDNIQALTRLGRSYFQQGGDGEKKAYSLFNDIWLANKLQVPRKEINMGRLYEANGRDASSLYQRALERDPQTLATQLAVAKWAIDTGKLDIATRCSAAASKLAPSDFQTRQLEGILALYNQDYAGAERIYRIANQLQPSNNATMASMAVSLIEQSDEGKRRQALEYATMNLRLLNDRSQQSGRDAAVTMAWVLYRLGNVVQAERTLRDALAGGGVGFDSAYFAAQILSERGQAEASIQLLKPALATKRLFPSRKAAEALLAKLGG